MSPRFRFVLFVSGLAKMMRWCQCHPTNANNQTIQSGLTKKTTSAARRSVISPNDSRLRAVMQAALAPNLDKSHSPCVEELRSTASEPVR
jgi:hypothetical protein